MNTKYISNDIYKMVNEMRQLVLLYGKNCFIATAVGEIENGLREYAKAAVIVAKHDIPPIVEKYGYCVANGDDEAFEYFKVGHIALEEDDVIILSSDGLTNYLLNVDSSDFVSESVSNIFINSLNFEGEINKSRNKEYDEFVSRFKKDMSFEENLNMHRLINEHANKYDIKLDDRTLIKIKIIL